MKNKITLYTNDSCQACNTTKEILKENNIDFKEFKTKDNREEWDKIVNLIGVQTTPTTRINDEFIIPGRDYQQPEQLVNIIKNFNNDEFSFEVKTRETLKTLTFSLTQALNRMFHEMRIIKQELNNKK